MDSQSGQGQGELSGGDPSRDVAAVRAIRGRAAIAAITRGEKGTVLVSVKSSTPLASLERNALEGAQLPLRARDFGIGKASVDLHDLVAIAVGDCVGEGLGQTLAAIEPAHFEVAVVDRKSVV